MDGRWLVDRRRRPAPRRATTCGWPTCPTARLEAPDLRVVQEGVDASTSLHVGRDGRVYVFTDRDAPRGRLAVTTPDDPAYETWTDLVPEDDEAVLEGCAILDGPARRLRPDGGAAVRLDPARDERDHRARAARPASAPARCRCPASGRSPGWRSGPRAATRRGSATPTTSRRRRSTATTRAPGRPRCGPPRPGTRRGARGARPAGRVHLRGRHHGADGRALADQGARPAAADGALRVRRVRRPDDARLLRRACSPGSRPAACTRSPSLRGGSEEGEQWHRDGHARAASRTSSTTSTPPPSGWSPTAGRRRTSWRSRAGRTAGCWSAPR